MRDGSWVKDLKDLNVWSDLERLKNELIDLEEDLLLCSLGMDWEDELRQDIKIVKNRIDILSNMQSVNKQLFNSKEAQ